MRYRTQHFDDMAAWIHADRPIGGIFPVSSTDRTNTESSWPERYRHVKTVYYIALPTGQLWCPWQKAYSAQQGHHGNGWNITGAWGRWTVRPSIQVNGWHGYLTKGILHESNDSVKP